MKHQLNIISELMNLWINEANDCWCWMKTKGIGDAAAVNPSTLFFSLWEWEKKWSWWSCCFAALSAIWKTLFFNEGKVGERAAMEERASEAGWGRLVWFFFLWWVMAAARGRGSAKRKTSQNKQTNPREREWIAFLLPWAALCWMNQFIDEWRKKAKKKRKQWTPHQGGYSRRGKLFNSLHFSSPAARDEEMEWNWKEAGQTIPSNSSFHHIKLNSN